MADLASTRGKIADALDEADVALGNPPTSQVIATLQQQVTDAGTEITRLNGIINSVKALVNG